MHSIKKCSNKLAICLSLFIFLPTLSYSQIENEPKEEEAWGGYFDIGLQQSSVKNEVAEAQGVPSKFSGLTLGLGIFYDNFLLGVKFGGEVPDDKKPFTNHTTEGDKESHVELTQLSLYGGLISPKVTFSAESDLFLMGLLTIGNMWAFGEERSINGCSDCDVEELTLNGGCFLEPEIYFVYSFVGLGFGYRYFFNADYLNKIELKISFLFYE